VLQCKLGSFTLSGVPNPMFSIWKEGKLLKRFYTSNNEEVSGTHKLKICQILQISLPAELLPTLESIDSAQLPETPTFTNAEGRRYWFF
jgi:hypothetical protein